MDLQRTSSSGAREGLVSRDLKGKVALVVGAGCSGPGWGTGKAIAVHLARLGATVAGMDIKQSAAEETGAVIQQEGGQYLALGADATLEADAAAAVDRCRVEFGRVDILVNNLGIAHVGGAVDTMPADWDRVFRANVTSAYLMSRLVLPGMLEARAGSIINISSIGSHRWTGVPLLAYSASKAAMNQMTQSVALQYAAYGIRCNAVLPGMLMTPMMLAPMKQHYGADVDHLISKRNAIVPTGQMGTGWDIAYAVGFLASDESRYINGVLLPVDGGLSGQVTAPAT
jgi:NAD(P)-dependent dehydrogenase (short-subunit alcohol dehydrogenase family)